MANPEGMLQIPSNFYKWRVSNYKCVFSQQALLQSAASILVCQFLTKMEISHSKACCSRPPITFRGGYNYTPTGKYVEYDGLKTCKLFLNSP